MTTPDTAAKGNDSTTPSFLDQRRDWLRVETIDRGGGAWDVALVIDGTYFGEGIATKADTVRYFTEWLRQEMES